MLKILQHPQDLTLDANCTYPPHFLLQSSCSGHGSCVSGVCICSPGWQGSGDYINLQDLDCQLSTEDINNGAGACMLGASYCVLNSVRIIVKVLRDCRERERGRTKSNVTSKAKGGWRKKTTKFASKPPVIFALHAICYALPILIVSIIKLQSQSTVIIGPSSNPVFFTYALLTPNHFLWSHGILVRSIVQPIVKGINSTLDRDVVMFLRRFSTVSHRFGYADLAVRSLLTFAAIAVAGYEGAQGDVRATLCVLLVATLYNYIVNIMLLILALYAPYKAIKLCERKKGSSLTGEVDPLKMFRRRVKVMVYAGFAGYCVYIAFKAHRLLGKDREDLYTHWIVEGYLGVHWIFVWALPSCAEICYLDTVSKPLIRWYYGEGGGTREKSKSDFTMNVRKKHEGIRGEKPQEEDSDDPSSFTQDNPLSNSVV